MHKSTITALLIAICLQTPAQDWHAADSLRKAFVETSVDTARANTLLRLAEFEIFKPGEFKKDLDSAAAYINQARSINQKLNSIEIYGHIILTESYLVKERGQKPQGKALAEKAVQILSKGTDNYQLGQAYLAIAEYYHFDDYNDSTAFGEQLKTLAAASNAFKNSGNVEREALAYKMLGGLETNTTVSLQHLKLSLELYKSIHYKDLQGIYDEIGSTYLVATDYRQALNYLLMALKAAQDTRDTSMQLCEINNHIGITYYKLLEFDQAIKYFTIALKTAETFKDVPTIYLLTTNICNGELRLKNPQEVLNSLQHSLSKYPAPQGANDLAFTMDFVQAYTMLNQFNQAKHYSDHLLELIRLNLIHGQNLSNAYVALITYYFASKQYTRELVYLMKNDTLTRKLGISTNINANNFNWFKLDTAQHNYKAAIQHLLIHDKINDSTFTVTKNEQIKQLQIQFETKEKEDQISLLNQKTALQQSNLNKANLLKNATIVGIVLVLIIASLLYRQSSLRQRNNKIITRQSGLITHKNEILQKLVAEKDWLLKEVHHRVKNNLHTVICLLESQAAYLDNDALKAIENSKHRIYAMSLIHQKLYQSDDIKTIDMSEYIPELVKSLEDGFGTSDQIEFKIKVEPINLTVSHAIPLGLIINEAVTNSIKYAFPANREGEISISMVDDGQRIKLELADDGIGMPLMDCDIASGSLGLELMKGLCEDIEAAIRFKVDHGTQITIIFEPDVLHKPGNFLKSAERKEVYV